MIESVRDHRKTQRLKSWHGKLCKRKFDAVLWFKCINTKNVSAAFYFSAVTLNYFTVGVVCGHIFTSLEEPFTFNTTHKVMSSSTVNIKWSFKCVPMCAPWCEQETEDPWWWQRDTAAIFHLCKVDVAVTSMPEMTRIGTLTPGLISFYQKHRELPQYDLISTQVSWN